MQPSQALHFVSQMPLLGERKGDGLRECLLFVLLGTVVPRNRGEKEQVQISNETFTTQATTEMGVLAGVWTLKGKKRVCNWEF